MFTDMECASRRWSRMRTFAVRTIQNILLLVFIDAEERCSATELEMFCSGPSSLLHYSGVWFSTFVDRS